MIRMSLADYKSMSAGTIHAYVTDGKGVAGGAKRMPLASLCKDTCVLGVDSLWASTCLCLTACPQHNKYSVAAPQLCHMYHGKAAGQIGCSMCKTQHPTSSMHQCQGPTYALWSAWNLKGACDRQHLDSWHCKLQGQEKIAILEQVVQARRDVAKKVRQVSSEDV